MPWREAIDGQLQERKRIQEELDGIFKNLKRLDPSSILKNNVTINEDQAFLLPSSQMSFHGVVILLKLALDHVPGSFFVFRAYFLD